MDSSQQESTKKSSRKSRSSGSSRKSRSSRKSSGSSKSRSPKRNEPRRSKRSKEDQEAKEKARTERDNGNVAADFKTVDHSGTVEAIGDGKKHHRSSKRKSPRNKTAKRDATEKIDALVNRLSVPITGPTPGAHATSRGNEAAKDERAEKATRNELSGVHSEEQHSGLRYITTNDLQGAPGQTIIDTVEGTRVGKGRHRKSKRRSQQDRGIRIDAATKINNLLDMSNQPITGPEPGAHADSRGNGVPKDKTPGNGRHSRPLGTQSVFTEERSRMEESGEAPEQDGLAMANAVDSHDEAQAMDLINSMPDQIDEGDETGNKRTKKRGRPSNSSEENNEKDNRDSDEEQSKLRKSIRIFLYLCCILVLACAGVATWLALRSSSQSESMIPPSDSAVPGNLTTDTGTVAPPSTQNPASTLNPDSNATSAPTVSSSNNGIGDIIFEAPSAEDCAAILTGEAIPGQDTMTQQVYQLDLDATPFLPMDLGISAGIIEDKLRELLTPAVTGCNRDTRDLRHYHRNLAEGSFSYAIGNVMVDAFGEEGVTCRDNSSPKCHRIGVTLDVVVKDTAVRVAAVITELSIFLGGGGLAEKLDLAELYESIKVANLGSTVLTGSPSIGDSSSPSMQPSKAPSAVDSPTFLEDPIPSENPTGGPTSKPTPLPTFAPVVGPTPPPTQQPTPAPVVGPTSPPSPPPTPSPTLRPTPAPTLAPVIGVAPLPTQSPTPRLTPFPTPFPILVTDPSLQPSTTPSQTPSQSPSKGPSIFAPVADPTLTPSTTPSQSASKSPSRVPSSSPSFVPSIIPSSKPSLHPSSGPSKYPSTAPSKLPSTAPSSAPVGSLLSTNRCGYLESVLGSRASLHQRAIDWMCNVDTWEPSEAESYPEEWHDRYAVTAFIYASNGDDPDTFNDSSYAGWSTKSTCEWDTYSVRGYTSCYGSGPTGSRITGFSGADQANENGYVPSAIGLLTNMNTVINAPPLDSFPEITTLTRLTVFDAATGGAGTIASELFTITSLTDLNIVSTAMDGTIPSEIGNLSQLTKLTLIDTAIEGNIPSEIGNLSQLTELKFTWNKSSQGTIPSEIGNCRNLEYISFDNNLLYGTFPTEIGNLNKLTYLNLDRNRLYGTMPTEIGKLSLLEALRLAYSNLSGTIPASILALNQLTNLGAFNNSFTGTVPQMPRRFDDSGGFYLCNLRKNCFSNTLNAAAANCLVDSDKAC